jgi:hypothetical protein
MNISIHEWATNYLNDVEMLLVRFCDEVADKHTQLNAQLSPEEWKALWEEFLADEE